MPKFRITFQINDGICWIPIHMIFFTRRCSILNAQRWIFFSFQFFKTGWFKYIFVDSNISQLVVRRALLFCTPFKLLCPALFMICCSSKLLWYNWVARVRLPDLFVKFPSKPALQHISFIKFSSLFTQIFCFKNFSVPEIWRLKNSPFLSPTRSM